MYFARKIVFINESLIFYRQRTGSIMKGRLSRQSIKSRFGMIADTMQWLKDKTESSTLNELRKKYTKTLTAVLIKEAFAKHQFVMIPVIVWQLVVSFVDGRSIS